MPGFNNAFTLLFLIEMLVKISNNYLDVKKEEFTGHNHAKFIRDSSKEIIKLLPKYEKLFVKSSPGQHKTLADVPWIAFMDENITTSTQKGYYVVYLFSVNMKTVTLSLAQGITEI